MKTINKINLTSAVCLIITLAAGGLYADIDSSYWKLFSKPRQRNTRLYYDIYMKYNVLLPEGKLKQMTPGGNGLSCGINIELLKLFFGIALDYNFFNARQKTLFPPPFDNEKIKSIKTLSAALSFGGSISIGRFVSVDPALQIGISRDAVKKQTIWNIEISPVIPRLFIPTTGLSLAYHPIAKTGFDIRLKLPWNIAVSAGFYCHVSAEIFGKKKEFYPSYMPGIGISIRL